MSRHPETEFLQPRVVVVYNHRLPDFHPHHAKKCQCASFQNSQSPSSHAILCPHTLIEFNMYVNMYKCFQSGNENGILWQWNTDRMMWIAQSIVSMSACSDGSSSVGSTLHTMMTLGAPYSIRAWMYCITLWVTQLQLHFTLDNE